jgi:uncharacterized protein YndB with AHSA1/START domain
MSEQKVVTTDNDFTITRVFDAPPADVWRTWTDPECFTRWFNAVPGSVDNDVRPGGSWGATLREPEGMRMSGKYREVEPLHRLVWAMETPEEPIVMHATFTETPGGRTETVYGQNVPEPFPCEQAVAGATAILDAFEAELAGGGGTRPAQKGRA